MMMLSLNHHSWWLNHHEITVLYLSTGSTIKVCSQDDIVLVVAVDATQIGRAFGTENPMKSTVQAPNFAAWRFKNCTPPLLQSLQRTRRPWKWGSALSAPSESLRNGHSIGQNHDQPWNFGAPYFQTKPYMAKSLPLAATSATTLHMSAAKRGIILMCLVCVVELALFKLNSNWPCNLLYIGSWPQI